MNYCPHDRHIFCVIKYIKYPLIHLKPTKVFDFDPIILIVMLLYLIC